MKNLTPSKKLLAVCFLFFMLIGSTIFAQVGIGTVTPDASSILDISSTTQGMLAPRLTTAQRIAIASPANGLMVFDTDVKAFHYYNSTSSVWIKMFGDTDGRLKFKRIKSTDVLATALAAEKIAGGDKYLLDTNTLYEINGVINVDFPIELNNAYVIGLDSGEDKLVKASGDLFTGTTGGSIRVLTLVASGGNIFNITGDGNSNLILRDCVVANSANVGLIKNFSLVFVSIVQYVGNSNGIVYQDIKKLLINNAGWFGGALPLRNSGTYEKIVGTFEEVTKQGGFSEVSGAAIGFDVSADPSITGDAVMESVVFAGNHPAGYVNPYTAGIYTGYNFNDSWNVRCAGIPTEGDSFATGFLYDSNNTSATRTVATTAGQGYKVVTNPTLTNNLFRVKSETAGRLTYKGRKSRVFQVNASLSFVENTSGNNNTHYVFYFVKIASDGTTVTALPATETFIDTNGGLSQAFPVSGTVQLSTNESVEIYLKRISNPSSARTNIDVYSLNLSMR